MLKQLILTRKLKELRSKLATLSEKDADFATRKAEMKKREEELEAAINEINDETSEEDQKTVEDSVAEFENDQKTLEAEENEHVSEKKKLEDEIQKLQEELDEVNARAASAGNETRKEGQNKKREDEKYMRNRNIFGDALKDLITRSEIKDFLGEVRSLKGQKRAVTGAELTIPEPMLDLLKDNMYRYSKLITKVRLRTVSGKARQNVMGTVPEGIWTEATGILNKLAFSFNQIEVDGYKVGGYVAVPNSTLEDSDINLASELLDGIGQAIGLAVDKAIIYGTGTKMPVGIVTRLAQTEEPSSWDANAPTWVDLHETNIKAIDMTDVVAEEFFAELMLNMGIIDPAYSNGTNTFWAMNRKTRMAILANAITVNAAGAIVAGFNATMPVEGGDIVELPFMSDGDIVGGFGSLYLLAERAGSQLAVSEHAKFIEDQTTFKGTARYDGMPVRGQAFVALNINDTAPATTKEFATDAAN
jgi:HK97 family phage major capsid protein